MGAFFFVPPPSAPRTMRCLFFLDGGQPYLASLTFDPPLACCFPVFVPGGSVRFGLVTGPRA